MKTKKVTIYDIAKKTGLSVATISRVLNNSSNVKPETKLLVQNVMEDLNYVPNIFARSLKNDKSYSIGIIVHDIASPFFSEIVASIEDYFTNKNYHIMLAGSSANSKNELHLVRFFLNKKVDGIMFLGFQKDQKVRKEIEIVSSKMPVVFVGDYIDLSTVYSVNCDNHMGAYKATQYLIDLGHKHIAAVSGYKGQYDSEERLIGYKEALNDYGIEFNENYVFQGDYSVDKCMNRIYDFYQSNRKITAFFCFSDLMAIGTMSGLLQKGFHIPQDFSIVGFDNIKASSYFYPPITTVDQDIESLGNIASSLLHEALNSLEMIPQRVINKTNLILRESTASLRQTNG